MMRFLLALPVLLLSTACGSGSPAEDRDEGLGPSDLGTLDLWEAGDLGDHAGPFDVDDLGNDVFFIPEGCNPLAAAWDCLLPFPSDWFQVEDDALPSGRRVAIPENALMWREDGQPVDLLGAHPADGFSHLPQILAVFPAGIDDSNLVFHTGDVLKSLDVGTSPTVILEADTGEPVLHFAELDPLADPGASQALMLRPMVRLKNKTRYVVALRDLKDAAGNPLDPPTGFRRVRDGQAAGHEVLGDLAERFEKDVFPMVEKAGIDRGSLQLAWDFTTGSMYNIAGDMMTVWTRSLERFSAEPPAVTVTQVTDDYDSKIFRRIDGTIRVPLFMESAEPGAALHRDEAGEVTANGEADVKFLMLVPRSVALRPEGDPPARLVQYGHGFFGHHDNMGELGGLYPLMQDHGFVFMVAGWWGMTDKDVPGLLEGLTSHPGESLRFSDRVHQGMVNQLALTFAARETFGHDPAFSIDGKPVYDPGSVYFYGISEGHILGGTFVALSPHIDRAVLGVGGAGISFIMPRSRSTLPFVLLLSKLMTNPLDVQKFLSLMQTTLDRIDPVTYVPHLLSDTFLGCPEQRRVLMHLGVGDAQVPNLSGHLHARSLGLGHLQPAPREVAGLEPVDSPHDGSALVEFDFGIDPLPGIVAAPPPDATAAHEGVRRLSVVNQQIDIFLRPDGQITHTCDGVCDPE